MGFVIWFASGECHKLQKGPDIDIQQLYKDKNDFF